MKELADDIEVFMLRFCKKAGDNSGSKGVVAVLEAVNTAFDRIATFVGKDHGEDYYRRVIQLIDEVKEQVE